MTLNRGFGVLFAGLAAGAWLTLSLQASSLQMAMGITAGVYLLSWVTMLVAMMLPATAPLALAYGRVVRSRGGGQFSALPFTVGYLMLWTLSGIVPFAVFAGSRGLVAGMGGTPLGTAAVAAVLAAAGLYQLSPLKGVCLRACRSPLGFLATHDFDRGPLGGVLAGIEHGAYCLGCCWALMTLLTVVGLMNLAWMAVLAILILAEKNWRHGAELAKAAGAGMLLGAIVMLL